MNCKKGSQQDDYNEMSFIFEDQSSTFLRCDTVTTQCSKIPQRLNQTRRVSLGGSSEVVDQKKKDLDEWLATTMKGLSVEERNAALEEVNGIFNNDLENSNEVPQVLDRKLIQLDEHLQRIKSGSVYETAESMDPEYVQDRKFRLMFLRSQRYDPQDGAEQILKFLDTKQWLWGTDKLCKDITLDDLTEQERQFLKKGISQVLKRDVGGRMICTYLRGMIKDKDIMMECRCKYYTLMSLVESEETQKKGVIALLYVVGDHYKDKKGGGWDKIGRVAPNLPIHWAGFHFCCDDIVQYVLIRAIVLTFPKHLAAKFRCHKGTHIECMYAMRAYGIPTSAVPIPDTGGNKPPLMYQHTIWYQNRERIERERKMQEQCAKEKLAFCNPAAKPQNGFAMAPEPARAVNIIPDDDDEFLFEDRSGDFDRSEEFEDPFRDGKDPFMMVDDIGAEPQQQQPTAAIVATKSAPSSIESGGAPCPVASSAQSQAELLVPLSLGAAAAANTAITPRRTDVLFGTKYLHHPGTLQLQQVVSQQMPTFESIVHRHEKTKFVGMLLQYMKASGVRFLTLDAATKCWVEVDDKIARNKVSKAFRNKRRTTGMGPSFFDS